MINRKQWFLSIYFRIQTVFEKKFGPKILGKSWFSLVWWRALGYFSDFPQKYKTIITIV